MGRGGNSWQRGVSDEGEQEALPEYCQEHERADVCIILLL